MAFYKLAIWFQLFKIFLLASFCSHADGFQLTSVHHTCERGFGDDELVIYLYSWEQKYICHTVLQRNIKSVRSLIQRGYEFINSSFLIFLSPCSFPSLISQKTLRTQNTFHSTHTHAKMHMNFPNITLKSLIRFFDIDLFNLSSQRDFWLVSWLKCFTVAAKQDFQAIKGTDI